LNTNASPLPYPADPARSALLVIDIQERLTAAVPVEDAERVVRGASVLAAAAQEFGFPILHTEQYPRGLGPTVEPLRAALPGLTPFEKTVFNCCAAPGFSARLAETGASDVIVCGIEAHVCVLQTAFALQNAGYRVFVAADAVASRARLNWELSLDLMARAGMTVGTTEVFLFGLLGGAGSERFKRLSALVK